MVKDEKEVTNTFNDFFVNIAPNLGINPEMISLILQTFLTVRLKILFINMTIILVSLQLKNMSKVLITHFSFERPQKGTLRNL